MKGKSYDLGMVGLGVMGRNLLLNMADHGYSVVGLDTDTNKVQALLSEGAKGSVDATTDVKLFVSALRSPRAIVLLVPAGAPVDSVVAELKPLLSEGDLIIDGGNSHFTDTDRRSRELERSGLQFFGMGVSGGEAGARRGPSMMPGGPQKAYDRVKPILESISAKVDGEPCVAYVGPGASGHYVKMVHNGIEYGLMQLIAEAYDLMKRGLNLTNAEIQSTFSAWASGELNSFLIEITAEVFSKIDPKTHRELVDVISDVARQKGTGKWTCQEAMEVQVPIPTIDAAVNVRDLSRWSAERNQLSRKYETPTHKITESKEAFLEFLHDGLSAAVLLTYSQGMDLLKRGSDAHAFHLELETIARIWRGGCIIRASLLADIRKAYRSNPDLTSLLLDDSIAKILSQKQLSLRKIILSAIEGGIAVPAMMGSLAYFDGFRTQRLPTNLTQAQRDFFGAHGYERIDESGTFHTHW